MIILTDSLATVYGKTDHQGSEYDDATHAETSTASGASASGADAAGALQASQRLQSIIVGSLGFGFRFSGLGFRGIFLN